MTEYGEHGFVPTVTGYSTKDGYLELETLDPKIESNLVSTEDGLKRRRDL
jgi:hypothetical protein